MPRSWIVQSIAKRSTIGAKPRAESRSGVDVELDPLEEQAGRGVGVLVGLDHVAAHVGDERADRGHDAGPVGALEEEHGAHGGGSEQLQVGVDVAAQPGQIDLDARRRPCSPRRRGPAA